MERIPDDYDPAPRLLASLVIAMAVVRCTDHPLVATALVLAALVTIWVWP